MLYIVVGWVWQFPQTLLGWIIYKTIKNPVVHIGSAGFKFILIRNENFPPICLGEYLFTGNTNLTRFLYGRGILSRKLGPLFIPLVSIPSILLLIMGKPWYLNYWGTRESMKYVKY